MINKKAWQRGLSGHLLTIDIERVRIQQVRSDLNLRFEWDFE